MQVSLFFSSIYLFLLGILLSGCAHLHHIEIGEIDQRSGSGEWIEVKASEAGLDISEAAQLSKIFVNSKAVHKAADTASSLWRWLTYGPKTGNVVFSDTYATDLAKYLHEECPNGKITGIISMRETNKYPVVSGEVVRLRAYCVQKSSRSGKI